MSDKVAKLVRMANQIAGFFTPYPEAERVAGVAEHIRSFWTPAMRRDILAHAAAGGEGLDPVVAAALAGFASGTESPAEKATAHPRDLGQAAGDAG